MKRRPPRMLVGVRLSAFSALLVLSAATWFPAACGGKAANGGTDTSTNWVKSCDDEAQCSEGASCQCSICTSECESDADCANLAPDATCQPTPGCSVSNLCAPKDFDFQKPSDGAAGGSGSNPDYPAACRAPCEESYCPDGDGPLSELPDAEQLEQLWGAQGCGRVFVRGQCAGGITFVFRHTGYTSAVHYYDAEGSPLGIGTSTDVISSDCQGKFYWPEPILCEDGEVDEVYCRDSLETIHLPWADGTPRGVELTLPDQLTPPARCRSQCELATSCEELPEGDFPDLDPTRDAWAAADACWDTAPTGACGGCSLTVLEGGCAGGPAFIHRHNGTVGELRYFDDTGRFLGLTTSTDDIDMLCLGQSYWPEAIGCESPVVTTVHCGNFPVGSPIVLPWAHSQPVDSPYSVP